MPDGSLAYTRDGSFQLSATGQLVTASGYPVQPAITIPQGAQSVTVGTDGTVQVQLAGQTAPSTVGTVQLANFVNPAGSAAERSEPADAVGRERHGADRAARG